MGFFDKIMDDVLGDPFGSYHQAAEAQGAAQVQAGMAEQGIEEQRRASDIARQDLQPFVQQGLGAFGYLPQFQSGGAQAFGQQQDILGMRGNDAQQSQYNAILNSPQYQYMVQQGENALMQNASATGGLRGGNTQAALAQFRPQVMNQLIDQQYGRLGGLAGAGLSSALDVAGMGQASAAGQAGQAQQTGANVANLLGQQGAALAGGRIAGSMGAGSGLSSFLNVGSGVLDSLSGAKKVGLF